MNNKLKTSKLKMKNRDISKETFSQCFFFYAFYLFSFLITLIIMRATNLQCSTYQGVLLGGTILALKCVPLLTRISRTLLICSFFCFLFYPLLGSYTLFVYAVIFIVSISIIVFTIIITSCF